jgi:hypothetical protein
MTKEKKLNSASYSILYSPWKHIFVTKTFATFVLQLDLLAQDLDQTNPQVTQSQNIHTS